ncbi:MAG: Rne/Rng family ribonuclease [Bacillota bacterium]|jgi:ribonuclease G
MTKEIIVRNTEEETMVAVTEDHKLVEIYFERAENQSIMGNIYKGKVENVLPGMQAAFVNMGEPRNGFLYVNDAVPRRMDEEGNILAPGHSIDEVLKQGQEIMVQIMKEPVGSKGARITTHPTLPGRFTVLMPTVKYIGISRRIEDEAERSRLKELMTEILDDKAGAIIRTSAAGVSREELEKDVKMLLRQWRRIQQKALKTSAPAMIHKDYTLLERMVRDVFVGEIDRIYADSGDTKEKLKDILDFFVPDAKEKVVVAARDIMQVNDIDAQLERALRNKVWLKCGGYLVIEQMEALTVIDVNTGKYVGVRDLENTVFTTNMEAATEIAKQLRLRNIGGIIIIDFIDMRDENDKTEIISHLEKELKKDRIKTNILGLTQLGLLEMTRKKNGKVLSSVLMKDCIFCNGRGKVYSEESVYIRLKKELFVLAAETSAESIYIEANPTVAAYLIGAGGSNLASLEQQTGKKIFVKGNTDMHVDNVIVRPHYEDGENSGVVAPVSVGDEITMRIDGLQDENPADGVGRINGFVVIVEDGGKYLNMEIKIKIQEIFKTYGKGIAIN